MQLAFKALLFSLLFFSTSFADSAQEKAFLKDVFTDLFSQSQLNSKNKTDEIAKYFTPNAWRNFNSSYDNHQKQLLNHHLNQSIKIDKLHSSHPTEWDVDYTLILSHGDKKIIQPFSSHVSLVFLDQQFLISAIETKKMQDAVIISQSHERMKKCKLNGQSAP